MRQMQSFSCWKYRNIQKRITEEDQIFNELQIKKRYLRDNLPQMFQLLPRINKTFTEKLE